MSTLSWVLATLPSLAAVYITGYNLGRSRGYRAGFRIGHQVGQVDGYLRADDPQQGRAVSGEG
jgi:hypothetical protein